MASISKNHLVPVLVQDMDAVILLVQLRSLQPGVLQRIELTPFQIALVIAPFYGVHKFSPPHMYLWFPTTPRGAFRPGTTRAIIRRVVSVLGSGLGTVPLQAEVHGR